ncbi:MAG TPA: glycosyltransferase, partial [Rhodocyclaceae bacterium]|nr:glycosyltransferase [Rhodocyclaceae bacterium]
LDGLLRHRRDALSGILNGIDTEQWDPATDPYLPQRYTTDRMECKRANKRALQAEVGLPAMDSPLLGSVGRMTAQKGVDLMLDCAEALVARGVQLALLGSGEAEFEQRALHLAGRHPQHIAVRIGYDEGLAHRIEAGADFFLMPSRFEPCGLNQLYSQRYGTPPIVHRTGGLADTVVDATSAQLAEGCATGIVFDAPTADGLLAAIERALSLTGEQYRGLQQAGMGRDFSWHASAQRYLELYRELASLAPLGA